MKQFTSTLARWVGSRGFFYGVVIFFVLESLWVAFSAMYPQAFDEDFHLGIITIYSHQWSPFLSGQPDNAGQYGALQHDPSYLYHYLMSFPYRLLTAITDNQTVQVVNLRILNVVFATAGIVLFRQLFRRVGTSPAVANSALGMFALVPIVPVLAGQINYDNLLLPLVALTGILVCRIYEALQRRQIPIPDVIWLVVTCMLAALIKYPFVPIAAVAVFFVIGVAWWTFRGRGGLVLPAVRRSWRTISPRLRAGLLVVLVVTLGLFLQRYGVNTVRYHNPVPECDSVLSQQECRAYGPWVRNHDLAKTKGDVDANPLAYTWQWLQSLHYRMFFAVNGPVDSHRNYPPLPLPSATAIVIAITGMGAVVFYWRQTFARRPLLVFLLLAGIVYCSLLWFDDYTQYLETGQPVAINGRYLLPILLLWAPVIGFALRAALSGYARLKILFAAAVLLLFLQGGGVLTFILRSDEMWYWQNKTVIHINNGARQVLAPFIIEGSKYY